MKRLFFVILSSFLLTGSAHATLFDWQVIGDAGNTVNSNGFGRVDYEYKIGTYEVTNAQYATFLNAVAKSDSNGLYSTLMSSSTHGGITRSGSSGSYTYSVKAGYDQRPVTYVNWYDSARYVNWLQNGMQSVASTTESGAYVFIGQYDVQLVGGVTYRQPTADVFLPSADEWYKAAFYDPNTGVYFTYAIGDYTITTSEANYANSVGTTTAVGSYATPSPNDTFDQNGNVWEWNDTLYENSDGLAWRDVFGGGWSAAEKWLVNTETNGGNEFDPIEDNQTVGFRIASVLPFDNGGAPIPEPSTIILGLIAVTLAAMRKRK
ncbi:MAG: PEP-CTERM sorting domain-containing protein [Candidatus Auribacter fodinae]|jgi:formylglycine-generating enzyme required for sulfatase activity|uniref:PEP-CTERM sorting domain-containing protein n=1 Tax=Candidatus Auribacter fodinae TaxID=2093366 RepID=A0A3A4RIB1_9BACT|nr:MAG: PEP-CTERM sorting domain-containing protein [Candidatus Auribacter fodinae]